MNWKKSGLTIKKVLKSILYTFFISIFSMFVMFSLINLAFTMSVEQSYYWSIVSIGIGVIFTIFYCSFTIIEEIRNKK